MKLKLTSLLTLLMAFVLQFSFAQQKTVTGTITDSSGLPLPGVSVVVDGTTRGVQTDFDGKYSVEVSIGEVLVFTFVGMKEVRQTVGESNEITFSMEDDATSLEEVVVTAFNIAQKKESLTGSVGQVKTEEIELIRNPNVAQGIVGKVAGVQVINNSGQPGAAPTIRVRGIGSVNASAAPLIVLNGAPFQGSLTSINPNDIASFNVLKDASATSLYGSRGANGVIIITTKKGKRDKLVVTIDMSTSHVSRAVPEQDIITDPGRWYEAFFQVSRNTLIASGETPANASQIAADNLIIDGGGLGYQAGYNAFNVPNNQVIDPSTGRLGSGASLLWDESWEDFLFENNISTKVFASVSGGSEKVRARFSAGHEMVRAFAIESDFERVTTNLNIDYDVSDNFRAGVLMNYTHTRQNVPAQGGIAGAFSWSRSIAPIYPVFGYDIDGTPITNAAGVHVYDFGDGSTGTPQQRPYGSFANPYATSLEDIRYNTADNINGQAYVEFNFLKDFKFRYNMNVDLRHRNDVRFETPIGGNAAPANGRSTAGASRNFTFTNQQLIFWNKSFGSFNFDALLGHETSAQNFVYLDGQKTNFLLPDQPALDQGVLLQSVNNNSFDYLVEGFFSRLNVNFDNKYYITANYRRDASSVFAPENRWGDFYGAGAAWRISQEKFMDNVSWINEFKLKGSIGQVGNDALLYPSNTFFGGTFAGISRNYLVYLDQFTVVPAAGGTAGVSLASLGNRDITWETTTLSNIGFELSMFDNRFSIDAEYFKRDTEDLLFNRPPVPSEGVPAFPENIGDMENVGFEVTINADVIRSQNFNVSLNLNATHYTNEITRLPDGRPLIDLGLVAYEVGRSIFDIHTREFAGVNQANGAALYYRDVLDPVSGDPTGQRVLTENPSDASQYFLDKTTIPDVFGGFGTNINYKNFNLGLNFAYQIGGYARDGVYNSFFNATPGTNFHNDLFTRTWTVDNPTAELPVVLNNDQQNYYGVTSSMNLIENTFLSLQDVTLSYDFSPKVAETLGFSNLRIYTTANNVFLWSKRKGYDPRLNLGATNFGSDFPLLRNITVGVNVQF